MSNIYSFCNTYIVNFTTYFKYFQCLFLTYETECTHSAENLPVKKSCCPSRLSSAGNSSFLLHLSAVSTAMLAISTALKRFARLFIFYHASYNESDNAHQSCTYNPSTHTHKSNLLSGLPHRKLHSFCRFIRIGIISRLPHFSHLPLSSCSLYMVLPTGR